MNFFQTPQKTPFPFKSIFLHTAFLFLLFLPSCSSTPDSTAPDTQVLSETDEQIFVGDTIEMNYNPNVIMKRAESYFDKESYPEAVVEYKHFLDLHRSHVLAPYAQHKIATSHFKMFKTVDRDLAPIKKSLESFQKLLSEFPGSRHETEAHEKIKKCHSFIAQHNLLVGQFYYRKDSYLAAAYRFETVIAQYPDLEIAGDAMYHLAQSYERLGANEWAIDWLVKWANIYPDSNHRNEGVRLLAELQQEDPDLLLARLNSKTTPTKVALQNGQNGQNGNEQNGTLHNVPSTAPSQIIRVTANPTDLAKQNGHSPSSTYSTVHPTDCSVGTWCERDSPSYNTVAHEPNAQPGLNGHSQTSTSISESSTSCSLGSWCETSTTFNNTPAPVIPPTHTTQCQIGQWCSKNS